MDVQDCHLQGKIREKYGFFQDQEIVYQVREIVTKMAVKSQGILRLANHLVWKGDSFVVKEFSFRKIPAKMLISVASLMVSFV